MKKTRKDVPLQDTGKAGLQQGLFKHNPVEAQPPVTVSPKTIRDRPTTGHQGIPGRSIPTPGQGKITTAKPKNRTAGATTTPGQIVLCGPDQEITTAEVVTTGAFKHGAISRRREANHRLPPAASTTAATRGVVQVLLIPAAALLPVQGAAEEAEVVAPVVEVQLEVEDDRQISASSYPNNNARVSLLLGNADF